MVLACTQVAAGVMRGGGLALLLLAQLSRGFLLNSRVESNEYLERCVVSAAVALDPGFDAGAVDPNCPKVFLDYGPAAADSLHTVVFSFKLHDATLQALENLLYEVSDPASDNYGHYLTQAELTAMIDAPSTDARIMVESYLKSFSSSSSSSMKIDYSASGEHIYVEAPVHVLELVLSNQFRQVGTLDGMYDAQPSIAVLAKEYSLPLTLLQHVDCVSNTIQLPVHMLSRARPDPQPVGQQYTTPLSFAGYTTPLVLNEHYNIFFNDGEGLGTGQAVYATNEQTLSIADLKIFKDLFKLPLGRPTTVIGSHVAERACPSVDLCAESNLDVQYITSVARNVSTTYFYNKVGSTFSTFLMKLNDLHDVPGVVSISYAMVEIFLTFVEKRRFDYEAIKLGLRGVTIVASSGDEGVSGGATNVRGCGYSPYFPASSPYVLAVGATEGAELGVEEEACQGDHRCGITSGGGFSNAYMTPTYQKPFVQHYFQSLNHTQEPFIDKQRWNSLFPLPFFSRYGRGYPDVSLSGSNYIVVVNGTRMVCSGTSASAPAVAGMVALVNARRAQAGRGPLGLLNPSIYKLNGSFANDITKGSNKCLRLYEGCCKEGFSAAAGWDPVTGFGTVDFQRLHDTFVDIEGHFRSLQRRPAAGSLAMGSVQMIYQYLSYSVSMALYVGCVFLLLLVMMVVVLRVLRRRTLAAQQAGMQGVQYGALEMQGG